jgi:hypothetical protein
MGRYAQNRRRGAGPPSPYKSPPTITVVSVEAFAAKARFTFSSALSVFDAPTAGRMTLDGQNVTAKHTISSTVFDFDGPGPYSAGSIWNINEGSSWATPGVVTGFGTMF